MSKVAVYYADNIIDKNETNAELYKDVMELVLKTDYDSIEARLARKKIQGDERHRLAEQLMESYEYQISELKKDAAIRIKTFQGQVELNRKLANHNDDYNSMLNECVQFIESISLRELDFHNVLTRVVLLKRIEKFKNDR